MSEPQKVLRQVTIDQEKILKVLDSLRYGSIENIKIKDGQVRRMEIRIILDFDDPESFTKTLDELRTIRF
jgi:hypothetical protein